MKLCGLRRKEWHNYFGVDRTVVTKHLGNIFKSGELAKEAGAVAKVDE